MTIGIPRGLFYYRYGVLWKTFFHELGVEVILSGKTDREILEKGNALAVDETCLSEKIFFGHVQSLIGKCDYLFVPRIASMGELRYTCPRFQALYDLCETIFAGSGQRFLTCNVDALEKSSEKRAYLEAGKVLGFPVRKAAKAYQNARKAYDQSVFEKIQQEEQLYHNDGMKILVSSHSYILEDEYIGRPVQAFFAQKGINLIRADRIEQSSAIARSAELSPNCRWEPNRELLGGISAHADQVDGILLMTAFPCCPDSIVNEIIRLKFPKVPMLNLVLDGQSGIAGLETRLESFTDIIEHKRNSRQ